jgi:S-adenosylmethionine:tRNA-ribosyltransferase-isomerase (queuine synthetase)
VLRLVGALDAKVRERIDARGGAQVDAAAGAPVAAVRTAERHELLAAETGAPAAPTAGLHARARLIDELHSKNSSANKNPGAAAGVL